MSVNGSSRPIIRCHTVCQRRQLPRVLPPRYGDMGLDYSENTRAMMARWARSDGTRGHEDTSYDWVIHNGDIR